MALINDVPKSAGRVLSRISRAEGDEIRAVVASFVMFFALLAAYYIIRPVRDEMGVSVGRDDIGRLFTVVFVVMLAAVPLFGWIASRFPRRLVLPGLYCFFAANMLAFWLTFHVWGPSRVTASVFFVWASVFNLFVISLFWSLMSELWSNEQAQRLFGFISAGGTAGALAGPLLTTALVNVLKPNNLLLVSAALLIAAMAASLVLRRLRPQALSSETQPAGGSMFDGAVKLLSSPYLGRIAVFVFLANLVGTFFYLEQFRLVGAAITDSAERIRFFASRDLIVSLATIAIEIFGTAAVMRRFGLVAALAALPVMAAIGTVAITSMPGLWTIAAVMAGERVCAFALSGPAIKVMYTLTTPAEKYKVQNFVDTVVYRGGDAVSGWLFSALGAGAGFASVFIPAVALPLTLAWFWTALQMGRSYEAKAPSTVPNR